MEKYLTKFMKNVKILNKAIAIYDDKDGNYMVMNTPGLLVGSEKIQVNEQEKKIAVFNQIIPKNMIGIKEKRKKIKSKEEITHKAEDKYTLIEDEEDVETFYAVSNQLGAKQIFTSKQDANELVSSINDNILELINE